MDLKSYFENANGTGVIATADKEGKVNVAIYARPHILDDGTLAFIATDRLTHANLTMNPHAAYLFLEEGAGYKGKRLHLTKIREEEESDLLYELRRRSYPPGHEAEKGSKFLIIFELDKELPLVGAGDE